MPNGHDYSKEYGPHDYGDQEGTCDCKHGCGCWMGPARSDGPLGVDPFGECPNNPKDTIRLPGKGDYEVVVTRRVRGLEKKLYEAKQELEKLREIKRTPKAKLTEELAAATNKLDKLASFAKVIGEKAAKFARR